MLCLFCHYLFLTSPSFVPRGEVVPRDCTVVFSLILTVDSHYLDLAYLE